MHCCHGVVLAGFSILACPQEGEQPIAVAVIPAGNHLAIYRWVNEGIRSGHSLSSANNISFAAWSSPVARKPQGSSSVLNGGGEVRAVTDAVVCRCVA